MLPRIRRSLLSEGLVEEEQDHLQFDQRRGFAWLGPTSCDYAQISAAQPQDPETPKCANLSALRDPRSSFLRGRLRGSVLLLTMLVVVVVLLLQLLFLSLSSRCCNGSLLVL